MKIIDKKVVQELRQAAQKSERKRKNMNYHDGDHDLIQRLLNAFEPGTYVRPHYHLVKREVFVVLEGRLLVSFFDNNGNLIRHVILDRRECVYAIEIEPMEYHTATALESGTVVYEIKDGPYDAATDKNFAKWAPEECTNEGEQYLKEVILKGF